MVAVVQLVEHQVVILGVAGSSPVSHPEGSPLILDSKVRGSSFSILAPGLGAKKWVKESSLKPRTNSRHTLAQRDLLRAEPTTVQCHR